MDKIKNRNELAEKARQMGIDIQKIDSYARILDEIFKKKVRENITNPTFITDYPIELSPLAKKKKDEKGIVERFQLIVAGIELCNAFSELNDPLDQESRFKEQEAARESGDEEAQRMDEDYVTRV